MILLLIFLMIQLNLKLSTVKGTKGKRKELKDVEPFHFSDNLHILPGNLELYKLDMASGTGRENRLQQYLREINKKTNMILF